MSTPFLMSGVGFDDFLVFSWPRYYSSSDCEAIRGVDFIHTAPLLRVA